jgi:hypothetical protein
MLGPDRGGVDCLGICNGRTAVGLGAENIRLPGNTHFTHERNRIIRWSIFHGPRIKSPLVMLRLLAFTFCLLVCPGIVIADDVEKDRAYAQFVREGDRARLVGRTPDALAAYNKALAMREEPGLLGRLGLAYLDGRQPVKAASFLFRALIDISDVPTGERWAIKDAYDRARSAVSRIKIDISQLGANVLVDGKPERSKTDANSFYFFITPGHHEFRATLAGYEDAVATIDVHKGETVPISLVLKAIPQPEPAPPEQQVSTAVTCAPCKSSDKNRLCPSSMCRVRGPLVLALSHFRGHFVCACDGSRGGRRAAVWRMVFHSAGLPCGVVTAIRSDSTIAWICLWWFIGSLRDSNEILRLRHDARGRHWSLVRDGKTRSRLEITFRVWSDRRRSSTLPPVLSGALSCGSGALLRQDSGTYRIVPVPHQGVVRSTRARWIQLNTGLASRS